MMARRQRQRQHQDRSNHDGTKAKTKAASGSKRSLWHEGRGKGSIRTEAIMLARRQKQRQHQDRSDPDGTKAKTQCKVSLSEREGTQDNLLCHDDSYQGSGRSPVSGSTRSFAVTMPRGLPLSSSTIAAPMSESRRSMSVLRAVVMALMRRTG